MEFERPADFDARLLIFGLDEAVRATLRAVGPGLKDVVAKGVASGVSALAGLRTAAAPIANYGRLIGEAEAAHFGIVLAGRFGNDYIQSYRQLNETLARFGLTPRSHVTISNAVLRAALAEIGPRRRFMNVRFAEATSALASALAFDVSMVLLVYQDGAADRALDKKNKVDTALGSFQATVNGIASAIVTAARSLDDGSATLKSAALKTVEVVRSASQVSVESTQGMASSAQATEELHLSINEIARAVGLGSESAKHAVSNAEDAKQTLDGLVRIASQVGSVVTVISSIAQQTNLLALNATIEAAHAGAAGRGFAVVASEVKALSARTAEATREISQQIHAMQESTMASAERMNNVIEAVTQAAATTNSIAVAIDQQRAVTKSIAETVAKVAEAADKANADLTAVSESAAQGLEMSNQIIGLAGRLATSADSLQSELSALSQQIKAA